MSADRLDISSDIIVEYIAKTEQLHERVSHLADSIDALVERINGFDLHQMNNDIKSLEERIDLLEECRGKESAWLRGATYVLLSLASIVTLLNQLGIMHISLR